MGPHMSSYSIGSIFPPFPPSAKGVCRGRPWTNSFIGGADDMDGMGRFITRTEMPHSHATLYGGMGNFGKATCVSCKSTVFNEWFDEVRLRRLPTGRASSSYRPSTDRPLPRCLEARSWKVQSVGRQGPADVDRPFLALSVGISADDVVSVMLDIEGDLPERLFDDSAPSQATLTAPCNDERLLEAVVRLLSLSPTDPAYGQAPQTRDYLWPHHGPPGQTVRMGHRADPAGRRPIRHQQLDQAELQNYRRMFGRSPQKDVHEIRNAIEGGWGCRVEGDPASAKGPLCQ